MRRAVVAYNFTTLPAVVLKQKTIKVLQNMISNIYAEELDSSVIERRDRNRENLGSNPSHHSGAVTNHQNNVFILDIY